MHPKDGTVSVLHRRCFSGFPITAWSKTLEKTKGVLGLGSDDAVKVWLNGKLVHENWSDRACAPDDDMVPVEFAAGKNQLLLKVQNVQGDWSFACRLL